MYVYCRSQKTSVTQPDTFQREALNCCCTWTQDPNTGDPWLCVGGIDARVKIYNVVTGEAVEV
jgi:hypothetical protein